MSTPSTESVSLPQSDKPVRLLTVGEVSDALEAARQVKCRRRLIDVMVGQLYPSILRGEIQQLAKKFPDYWRHEV